ncbi:MAG: serine/threonine-protein kinase [Acidobacteriota bacterium]|jgi:serine/threonine-protein kinase
MPIETPTHLGRYEILDEIGRGAMGVVYMAKDPLIGRLVALKTFRAGSALQGRDLEMFRERFIREAQSAGILSHPSIVTIHDVVEASEEGVTFIAMEYVRGTNLKDVLRTEGRLGLEEAAHIVGEVAEGLEYAHSRGVVHRDVKPANILLTEDRRVKLTDFGIARLGTSNLTHDGQLLGTPNYMAPEQIRGEAADHRADVFSLGVVLYEMLTGEKPFQGENVTVVTHRIAYEAFIPPERHGSEQPEPVQKVIDRALAKDPDERFPSVAEMARGLREAIQEVRNQELLNETQEIPEAPPPGEAEDTGPDTGRGTADGAEVGAGSGARAPGREAVARVRTAAAAAGAGLWRLARRSLPSSLERPPLRRLLLVTVATLVVAGGAAGLVSLLVRPSDEPPSWRRPDPIHEQRLRVRPVLRQASAALKAGQPEVALDLYRAAEGLAPDVPGIAEDRRRAERRATAGTRETERAEQLAEILTTAEEAVQAERWEDARSAAGEALALEAGNERAVAIVAAADEALERQARQARRPPPPAPEPEEPERADRIAEPAASAPAPAVAEEEAAEAPAAPGGDAELALDFFTAYPEGVLTVYLEDSQLLSEPFRFYRRERFFREGTSGTIRNAYRVPSGAATLRILLARPDRPTLTRVLQANFPPGTTRRLVIRLEDGPELTARLE